MLELACLLVMPLLVWGLTRLPLGECTLIRLAVTFAIGLVVSVLAAWLFFPPGQAVVDQRSSALR